MTKNLVTLRNAGSDLSQFLLTFQSVYSALGTAPFTLVDLVKLAVVEGLMSSNGRRGEQARARSFNKNTSLDSMPMQFKAYAEMYRLLGWLRSESSSRRTTYRVTFLGREVATQHEPRSLIEQCFLGIDLPNEVLQRDCQNQVRLLWCYLRTMRDLDTLGVKEEFILLCHAIKDDEDSVEYSRLLRKIQLIRTSKRTPAERRRDLAQAVEVLAASGTPSPVQANTLGNSTRITLAALKAFNWTTIVRVPNLYQGELYQLSPYGKKLADEYSEYYRPKCSQVMSFDPFIRENIAKAGLVQFFKRAGYNTENLEVSLDYPSAIKKIVQKCNISPTTPIMFSPYQSLSPEELSRIFGTLLDNDHSANNPSKINTDPSDPTIPIEEINSQLLISKLHLEASSGGAASGEEGLLGKLIRDSYIQTSSLEQTILDVFKYFEGTNKNIFYEIIAEAFRIIGMDCIVETEGQNGLRWDAICRDRHRSIPIEIKSPGEEEFISVKAVRQAVENRIVLCARQTYPTSLNISSFVVGYKYPNERAEVHALLEYVMTAFGIKVAIFSFETILKMVANKIVLGITPNQEELFTLLGLVEVES